MHLCNKILNYPNSSLSYRQISGLISGSKKRNLRGGGRKLYVIVSKNILSFKFLLKPLLKFMFIWNFRRLCLDSFMSVFTSYYKTINFVRHVQLTHLNSKYHFLPFFFYNERHLIKKNKQYSLNTLNISLY